MAPYRRILAFSVPFSGHLNVLKRFISEHGSEFNTKLVVTGWNNIVPDLGPLKSSAITLGRGDLRETDPALWTLPRVSRLMDDCLRVAQKFRPDLIIYDFFSLEGLFVGKLLGIPSFCSIPAMVGPFRNRRYVERKLAAPANRRALTRIRRKYGIRFNAADIEMVSDGLHIPGDVNLVWSYPSVTPTNFLRGRKKGRYVFIQNGSTISPVKRKRAPRPSVYVSLGTVVMDNLWNRQPETRRGIREFIAAVARRWSDGRYRVTFVTQGKQVLDAYPTSWRIVERADQAKELSRADIFVTHGGSNSFHEAVVRCVPVAVIPFFGDQALVGRQAERLGIGINLVSDSGIDTKKPKRFLGVRLADKLDRAVREILAGRSYRRNLQGLKLDAVPLASLLKGNIHFREGDLLYGTNVARSNYVRETGSRAEFRISEFRPFTELARNAAALPRVVDIYHDAIRDSAFFAVDASSGLKPYSELLRRYRKHLAGERDDLCTMCIRGIEFFTRQYRIHFTLDDYHPAQNYITTREIRYILRNRKRLGDSVIFYRLVAGVRVPVPDAEVRDILRSIKEKDIAKAKQRGMYEG